MSDEPLNPYHRYETVEPIPTVRPAPKPPPGPGWLLNLLLLFVLAVIAGAVPNVLVALEYFRAAGLVGGLLLLLAFMLVLRPLLVRGRWRFLKSFAFFCAFSGTFAVAALVSFLVLFKPYVVPTGAMASAIPGFHRDLVCPQCGHAFAVNASAEMDPQGAAPEPMTGCTCENCRYHIDLAKEGVTGSPSGGVRFLMARHWTPRHFEEANRYRVLIIRYPAAPPEQAPVHYVERLVGLPGETIAIHAGQLYRSTAPRHDDHGVDPQELWQPEYMHPDDPASRELFQQGKFEVLRKPPDVMLALRRLVYDNDHPARDLPAALQERWSAAERNGWTAGGEHELTHGGSGGEDVEWVRYQHLLRPLDWPDGKDRPQKPQLITDFSSYNSYELPGRRPTAGGNWVGDLMLEFEVTVEKAEGKLWLELARGPDRFRTRWDLQTGKCALLSLQEGKAKGGEVLREADTPLSKPGTYRLRFANFDQRLTVWVDDSLPFGDGVAYPRTWTWDQEKGGFAGVGPTENDLQPARLGSEKAAVRVRHLKLWRNTYYTLSAVQPDDNPGPGEDPAQREEFWSSPDRWEGLRRLGFRTLYVQPGHYLVLGDNSTASSDSRDWGVVPERYVQGHALLIYYPFSLAGRVR